MAELSFYFETYHILCPLFSSKIEPEMFVVSGNLPSVSVDLEDIEVLPAKNSILSLSLSHPSLSLFTLTANGA